MDEEVLVNKCTSIRVCLMPLMNDGNERTKGSSTGPRSVVYLDVEVLFSCDLCARMMLALARALFATSFPEVCRDKTKGKRGAQRARFRVAGRKIIAFMCRLDVVALSIFCVILFVAMAVVDFVLK